MGEYTTIEYADSTCNGEIGCDGCELLNLKSDDPAKRIAQCYAYVLASKMRGRPGWPDDFQKPQIFEGRIQEAMKWSDMTNKKRLGKEWLNGLPRVIFMNDMGDGFTPSLPLDWMLADMQSMERCPHVLLHLTKQGRRMRQFFEQCAGRLPLNFWPGVSLTNHKTVARLDSIIAMRQIFGERNFWISYEPATGGGLEKYIKPFLGSIIKWVVLGGESDQTAPGRETNLDWIRRMIDICIASNVAVFVKQLGSDWAHKNGATDDKGGNWVEWPDDLKFRQMPAPLHARMQAGTLFEV